MCALRVLQKGLSIQEEDSPQTSRRQTSSRTDRLNIQFLDTMRYFARTIRKQQRRQQRSVSNNILRTRTNYHTSCSQTYHRALQNKLQQYVFPLICFVCLFVSCNIGHRNIPRAINSCRSLRYGLVRRPQNVKLRTENNRYQAGTMGRWRHLLSRRVKKTAASRSAGE